MVYVWPFLGFSDPYPTRLAAIEAAVADIIETARNYEVVASNGSIAVIDWAKSLIAPSQLALFPSGNK